MRRHWSRSVLRRHNARMIEKGYHAAVVPIPSVASALLGFVRSVYWTSRENMAFRLAPWLRDD